MSEAPAVYYPKQTEPDGSTITVGKYVHWDIFDAYKKAVDLFVLWNDEELTANPETNIGWTAMLNAIDAARKAGESVR